jgi:hypothetical protein
MAYAREYWIIESSLACFGDPYDEFKATFVDGVGS